MWCCPCSYKEMSTTILALLRLVIYSYCQVGLGFTGRQSIADDVLDVCALTVFKAYFSKSCLHRFQWDLSLSVG